MVNKSTKKCSTSLAIKEMQVKMTLRFHLIPVRMVILKSKIITNAGEEEVKQELLFSVSGNEN
jgi:hypothetical protein